jgi:hypothetical protein
VHPNAGHLLSGITSTPLSELRQSNPSRHSLGSRPPMSTAESSATIVSAYRSLYRAGLRAVQYSVPNRYIIRDRLRRAFRESPTSDFSPRRIANTIRFLNNAAQDRGLEHKLVKNLCAVWHGEGRHWRKRAESWKNKVKQTRPEIRWETQAYHGFYWTLRMLNESMGLCIR